MKKLLLFIFALLLCLNVTSCADPNTKYYDSITSKLKLSRNVEGKAFFTDGIGHAKVDAYTDGDTTRFRTNEGEVIAVRYMGIDTPESTSDIEKWGKAASYFTKSKLESATDIVLEATADLPKHDSYGTRYLAYVWYKTEGSEYKLLNLEIVENGFSVNKEVGTDKYYSYFSSAENFAIKKNLRVQSPPETIDPLYSTDPVEISLNDFYGSEDSYYNEDTGAGALVKLSLTITDLYVAGSGTFNFTGTEIEEDGSTKSIQVYTGYGSSSINVGHKYYIVGNISSYNGKWQIANVKYNPRLTEASRTEKHSYIDQYSYYYIFSSSYDTVSSLGYCATLYTDITVKTVNNEGGKLTITGDAYKVKKDGADVIVSSDITSFTINVATPTTYSDNIKVGSKLDLTGYQYVSSTNVIDVLDYSNIAIK